MEFSWKEAVTLAIALVGAVLGVLNAWRNWNLDRVRLRVVPVVANWGEGEAFGIEVVNLGNFAVTLTDLGWYRHGTKQRLSVVTPIFLSGERLPVRLEPRTRLTGFAAPRAHEHASFANVRTAYAVTACGEARYGKSRLLRDVVKRAAATS
jgi:hypothetical protein